MSDARMARDELERLLAADAPTIAASLEPRFFDAAEQYVDLLLSANARLNLTRIVEPAEVARLHLLDALSALPTLDALQPARAIDIGSGGGVPGLVLALARPEVAWTLVDSVGKKADALRAFVEALGIGGVSILAERAEALGHDARHRELHDVATARACAALPVLAEYALPLVRRGGAVIAWKGAISAQELEIGRRAAETLGGRATVRETGIGVLGHHRLVVLEKVSETPHRFPRRPGEPARRPLG